MIDTEALRKKVIDLAIQGKLTEQLPSDGDAETLYAQILDQKSQLIKEGKIKKDKALPDIAADEIPFDIPDNWKWVRLGELCLQITDGTHRTPTYQNEGIPFLSVKNISSGAFDLTDIKYISKEEHSELIKRCKPEKNDVLVCRIGTLGKAITIDIDLEFSIFVSLGLIKTTDKTISDYIVQVINSGYGDTWIKDNKAGGAMHTYKINLNSLALLPVPLAPLSEIERILQLNDEVKTHIENIYNLQTKYSNDRAVLKSKIIDAGIQGKLTEQLPEDGDAEDLLARISEEKEKLISSGKIPKEKKLPKIVDEEKPFKIPNSWKWVRVQDVVSYITDYVANGSFATLKEHTKTYKEPNYAIFVRTMDFGTNFKEGCSYIDKDSYDFLEKSKLFGGELILPNIGASIGKAFIMPDLGMPMSLAPNSILLKFTESVMNEYFSFVIKSTYGAQLLNKTQGGSATAKFSKTDLRTLVVPLPPLNEIKRIVNKVDAVLEQLN